MDQKDLLLTIRKGKFGKCRRLPLLQPTGEALVRYIGHPLRPRGTQASAPLFVSRARRRLAYCTVIPALDKVCQEAQIPKPWPRPHNFRHTFAVLRVQEWYAAGCDVNARLPALSTYLGHVSVENTRTYLVANGILLKQAGERFERQTQTLDEVLL